MSCEGGREGRDKASEGRKEAGEESKGEGW